MDKPEPGVAIEWLTDEVGDQYFLDENGEPDYGIPQPGEDPRWDAWIRAKDAEPDPFADPDTPWFPPDDLEGAAWQAEMTAKHRARPGADPNRILIDNEDVEARRAKKVAYWEALMAAGHDRVPR